MPSRARGARSALGRGWGVGARRKRPIAGSASWVPALHRRVSVPIQTAGHTERRGANERAETAEGFRLASSGQWSGRSGVAVVVKASLTGERTWSEEQGRVGVSDMLPEHERSATSRRICSSCSAVQCRKRKKSKGRGHGEPRSRSRSRQSTVAPSAAQISVATEKGGRIARSGARGSETAKGGRRSCIGSFRYGVDCVSRVSSTVPV